MSSGQVSDDISQTLLNYDQTLNDCDPAALVQYVQTTNDNLVCQLTTENVRTNYLVLCNCGRF